MNRPAWPRSARGWAVYALAWATFALAFAAVSWIRDGGPSWAGISGAARVMLPAALWGIGVLALCVRVDLLARRSARTLLPHLLGALLYPALWVASASGLAALVRGASSGVWRWTLPPEHVLHWHLLTGILIYVTLAVVAYGLEHSARAERARQQAEWQLLRAQLNPHFLFNTLHAVFALARRHGDAGERELDRLSRVLRYSLHVHRHDREWVSLAEEWDFVRDYLELQTLRFGARLRWEGRLTPGALDCRVPPVLVQPLVENAIRHAVDPRPEGARLTIAADARDGVLTVRVEDDGPGCAPADATRSVGVGLRSIRARLRAVAPGAGGLTIESAPGRGFAAIVTLPARAAGGRTAQRPGSRAMEA